MVVEVVMVPPEEKATSVEKTGEFWPVSVLALVEESVYPPSNFQWPSRSVPFWKVSGEV